MVHGKFGTEISLPVPRDASFWNLFSSIDLTLNFAFRVEVNSLFVFSCELFPTGDSFESKICV